MDIRITAKLSEMYYGIVAYGRVSYHWFGVIDFAGLAAAAVNLLIKRGEINSWDKEECSRYMVNMFNNDIGNQMSYNDISVVVDCMNGINDIDNRLAGIIAVIEMAR